MGRSSRHLLKIESNSFTDEHCQIDHLSCMGTPRDISVTGQALVCVLAASLLVASVGIATAQTREAAVESARRGDVRHGYLATPGARASGARLIPAYGSTWRWCFSGQGGPATLRTSSRARDGAEAPEYVAQRDDARLPAPTAVGERRQRSRPRASGDSPKARSGRSPHGSSRAVPRSKPVTRSPHSAPTSKRGSLRPTIPAFRARSAASSSGSVRRSPLAGTPRDAIRESRRVRRRRSSTRPRLFPPRIPRIASTGPMQHSHASSRSLPTPERRRRRTTGSSPGCAATAWWRCGIASGGWTWSAR